MNKKSIKFFLIANFSIGAGIVVLLSFVISYLLVSTNFEAVKDDTVRRLVADSSMNVSNQIESMFSTAYTIAADEQVCNPNIPYEDKKDHLIQYATTRKINSIGYVSAEGYLISTDGFENDISNRDYFINLMNGGKYISNPSFNTATQSQIIFIGVPLEYNGKIVGAITCTFDSSYMSDIIATINYNGIGEAYMLSSTGTVIASRNIDDVLNKKNVTTESEDDSSLQPLAEIEQLMISSEEGRVKFNKDFLYYDKVDNSEGWTIVFSIPDSSFYSELTKILVIYAICLLVVILLIIVISYIIGSKLGSRLITLKDHLNLVASGDFSKQVDEKDLLRDDEIGMISNAIQTTQDGIGNILISIKSFANQLDSQAKILGHTSDTLSVGTSTVSNSISEIQIGNTEQANEIGNINSEMEKFNVNVEKIDDNINGVLEITSTATKKLTDGNADIAKLKESFEKFIEYFDNFSSAIESMNNNLSSVSMITSTISDIASETNLLSLNASIEAARAGEAGRGFSVVAQEISKLAAQCSDSVQQISNVVGTITDNSQELVDSTSTMGNQIKSQEDIIISTLDSFNQLNTEMENMFPQIKTISSISKDNLNSAHIIGDSISNANSISEELVATASEVNDTSESFAKSSDEVNNAAKSILELSAKLIEITGKFTI